MLNRKTAGKALRPLPEGGFAAAGGVASLTGSLAVGWSGRGQEAEEPSVGAGPAVVSGGAVDDSWLGRWEALGGVVSELD